MIDEGQSLENLVLDSLITELVPIRDTHSLVTQLMRTSIVLVSLSSNEPQSSGARTVEERSA